MPAPGIPIFRIDVDRVLSRVNKNSEGSVAEGLKNAIAYMVDNSPATARDAKQLAILVGLMYCNEHAIIRDKRYSDMVAIVAVLSVVAPAMFRRLCEVPNEFSHPTAMMRDSALRQLGLYYHPEHGSEQGHIAVREGLKQRFEAIAVAMQGHRNVHIQDVDPVDVRLIIDAVKNIPLKHDTRAD